MATFAKIKKEVLGYDISTKKGNLPEYLKNSVFLVLKKETDRIEGEEYNLAIKCHKWTFKVHSTDFDFFNTRTEAVLCGLTTEASQNL